MLFNNTTGSCWKKWDLHIHSTASDGKSSPQEIIDAAVEKGLSVIAITDHHTVDNVDRIKNLGKEKGVTVIAGIEFRTEYGQKSVHMIGLFPDNYNGMKLDERALKDLILAPLNLSRTHIISAARSEFPNEQNEDKLYSKGLLKVQVEFKKAADLIHKYGGLISVHAGEKQNSFDREMRHEGSGPKNVSLSDSLGPVKEELLKKYIDICEVAKKSEEEFYINTWKKPVIVASDAHRTEEISRHYTWIKAEASFEGLRQILYEPKDRVAIQEHTPEDKNNYLLIKSLHIKHDDFGEQVIPFNPGLNTIIGGRSSGKSILLGCIARLCGNNDIKIKENKPRFDEYIDALVQEQHMSLEWCDGQTSGIRKVDFFPQNYIIELASKPAKVASYVEKLLHSDDNCNHHIVKLKEFILNTSNKIHNLFNQLNIKLNELSTLKGGLESLGNKYGVELEIQKLDGMLVKIKIDTELCLSAEEEKFYKDKRGEIENTKKKIFILKQNIESLKTIKDVFSVNRIDIKSFVFDEFVANKVTDIYEDIEKKFKDEWGYRIEELVCGQKEAISACDNLIKTIEQDDRFCKIKAIYERNVEYVEISKRLSIENKRLSVIKATEEEVKFTVSSISNIKKVLIETYRQFYKIHKDFCDVIRLTHADISIKPQIEFKKDSYIYFIFNNFDKRGSSNQDIINFTFTTYELYIEFVEDFFNKLMEDKFLLKSGKSSIDIAESFLSMNPFEINYNITYQGDDLCKMSEGKAAFVLLRILLDFSQNDYPILIDQPEDDLDNRAIYFELVKYLREKKKSRQIILVTHNPNIVVGADAEEIIIANQHGENNKNPNNIKFAYYSGGLENSFQKESDAILSSKGIREHVCEILEGGEQAFKLRESKYLLK